jgi:hypothetical protein
MSNKTHLVIDETLTEEEGQGMFAGTHQECQNFFEQQAIIGLSASCGLKVVPMTKEELIIHNL